MREPMKIKFIQAIIFVVVSMSLAGCSLVFVRPSDMVKLGCAANPGETRDVFGGNPDGTSAGLFTVPAGSVLVITRVRIHPWSPGTGILKIAFIQSGGGLQDRILETWLVPNSKPTEFDFSPGIVISSESKLKIKNTANSAGRVSVSFNGYITPDK